MNHTAHLRRQKGQTLLLVAVALIGFVAMCALAIDLSSLYAARSEIQRAANATALAGAKAFVDSGVMTDPQNKNFQSVATTLSSEYATAAASQNLVAGAAAQVVTVSPPVFTPGNPQITVKLQSASLPLFFAHIWGSSFATVSATATAEAYNPGQSGSNSSSFTLSAPKCVKPILLPNLAKMPSGATPPFVNVTTGQVAGSFVGVQLRDVKSACTPGKPGCQISGTPGAKRYLPMQDPNIPQYLPACTFNSRFPDLEEKVAGCDGAAFNPPECGPNTNAKVAWDPNFNSTSTPSPVSSGLQCLIHFTGPNTQDSIPNSFTSGNGLLVTPGVFSRNKYGIGLTDHMLTSDSVITVPIFDQTNPQSGNQVIVVGFLTLFVDSLNSNQNGTFTATILNVTGCGPSATGTPISGGGVSAIPVRLIQAP